MEHLLAPLGRVKPAKRFFEYAFWVSRVLKEGQLRNAHYESFFTDVFGLDRGFYASKRMLDVGCGPRGSLEWATMASERVGLDPLADAYKALGTRRHRMSYIAAPAETMPLPDASFDVVSCINCLDHVDDVSKAIDEMTRVAAPDSNLLLIVDVNHRSSHTEPHTLKWEVVDRFEEWEPVDVRHYERCKGHVDSLRERVPYNHNDTTKRLGLLVARMLRT